MTTNESGVPARLKDLKESVKERFLGLLGLGRQKGLEVEVIEDEQEVFLQVGRQTWHAPRQLRVELWLSSLARRHALVNEYQTYLEKDITREAAVDIEKDVPRTFPSTRRFRAEEGQAQLRNVLRAYAAYDPEVAYCQGMNFLTGLLLMYMPTEGHAFAALVVLMEDRKLKNLYHRSMSLLQVQLWQLSRLISPALNRHLEALGVVPMLYGASWLMTAFSADFPLSFSARVMDVLLAEQCEGPLLKVAAFIVKIAAPKLLQMNDLEEVLSYLKIEVPSLDEHELHDVLQAAFNKPWTKRQLGILRCTEGAETVAQAMDRVMSMIEQAADEDDDADLADGRDSIIVPRLQPPPRCPTSAAASFAPSPACGTPIGGGPLGTGSIGGAANSPPTGLTSPKRASIDGAIGADIELQLHDGSAAPGSPAVWSIPSIHPNVAASPAIQAFRRAHLPCFVAGAQQAHRSHSALANASSLVEAPEVDAGQRLLTCVSEEWGDFNTPAARQHLHWRSLSRSTPGAARPPPHTGADKSDAGDDSAGVSIAVACSSAAASLGGAPTPDAQISPTDAPTQPIPVPWSSSSAAQRGAGSSAFAAAAAVPVPVASGRPPLPPRYASFERAAGPFSRLSVVAEDPPAVQMGPAAPAPSPRGSMDMYVLGRSGSQPLEGCEYGLLLCGGNSLGGGCDVPGSTGYAGVNGGVGSASCNGDCASGSASATTGGAFLSPSGISGAVSPHTASPRILSGWNAAAGAALGTGGGGGGSDTPTAGYVPLGLAAMERTASDTLLDHVPVLRPPSSAVSGTAALPTEQRPQPPADAQKDVSADIAGDILRMLTAVDTGSAKNVNNARAAMHEAIFADSPHKELSTSERLFSKDGEGSLHHMPSSSSLADLAAQDLAKAQEEAERVRQQLEAQLQQQRAAERNANAAPERNPGAAAEPAAPSAEVTITEATAPEPPTVASPPEATPAEEQEGVAAEAEVAEEAAAAGETGEAGPPPEAPAAPPAPAAAGGGAGPAGATEEFVLRRPTLYVDGIPMFDPRGLMADTQEAKVMFTPVVSPGAASYTEALPTAATPTGDAAAAASGPAAPGGDANSGADEASAPAPDSYEAAPTEADAAEAACDEASSPAPVEPAAESDERAVPAAPSPAPSEWVDWSQAPPIQAALVLSPSAEPAEEDAADVGIGTDTRDWTHPPAEDPAGTALLEPQPPRLESTADAGTDAPQPSTQPAQPPLAAADSVHVDPASVRQLPYGLLPATSTLPVGPPPLPHSHSCASSAGGSFPTAHGGAMDGHRFAWSQLRTDSFAPSDVGSRIGSQRWDGGISSDTDDGTPRVGDGIGHPMLPRGPLQPQTTQYRQSNLSHSGLAPALQTHSALRQARYLSSGGGATTEDEGELQANGECMLTTTSSDELMPPEAHLAPVEEAPAAADRVPDPEAEALPDTEAPATPQGGTASSAEPLPRVSAPGLDQRMSEAEAEAEQAPGATTPMGHSGSCEVLGEAEDGDGSPYRAALSPSLAHHIMSAYLRSEQHEQQQQQRELEERLQLQQQHQEQEQEPAAEPGAAGAAAATLSVGALADHAAAPAAAAAQGQAAPLVAVAGLEDLSVVAELSLCSLPTAVTPTATPTGLASPFLPSPTHASGLQAPPPVATTTAAAPACQQVKALTPFAVSLNDPAVCRISAEVLQAMPAPLALMPTEAPAPVPLTPGVGSAPGPQAAVGGSLGLLGSDDVGEASGLTGGAGLGGMQRMHSITLGLLHAPGSAQQVPPLRSSGSQDPPAGSVAPGLHSLPCHAHISRQPVGSSGGAVPPLLPPPPPPQVPLAHSAARPDVSAAASAPPLPQAAPAVPLPSQPVQCISAVDVTAVPGAASATTAGASAPAATQPSAPAWTATFDDAPSDAIRSSGETVMADRSQPKDVLSVGAASSGGKATGTPDLELSKEISFEAPRL